MAYEDKKILHACTDMNFQSSQRGGVNPRGTGQRRVTRR